MAQMYDVLVIGAGVVGCSAARELSKYQLKIAVAEKGPDVCMETSSRNSAVLHAGYNNKPGTLMAKFCVEGNRGFDQIAATAVKRAKKKYPDITLMLVLPYHPAERSIEKPPGYDGTYYPEGLEKTPRPFAIVKANQLMVDTCDWLVCYVRHGASNSRNLLEYAQRRANKGLIQIINIAGEMGINL